MWLYRGRIAKQMEMTMVFGEYKNTELSLVSLEKPPNRQYSHIDLIFTWYWHFQNWKI